MPLTAAGVPRKKPGRKPGSTVKPKEPKLNPDGTPIVEAPKVRRPRKPRDPNAPPIQRKRKAATQDPDADQTNTSTPRGGSATPVQPIQPKVEEPASSRMDIDSPAPLAAASSNTQHSPAPAHLEKVPKREGIMSLLNDDTPPAPAPAAPVRMAFDPVRSSSSYDPVRETMVTRDPYGTAGLASPRAPSQMPNRASASPSISSLVDPPAATQTVVSPTPGHASFTSQTRFQESSSLPPSPSQPARKDPPSLASLAPKSNTTETKKSPPTLMPQPPKASDSTKASAMAPPTTVPAPSKKVAAVQAQTRKEKKTVSSSSSPKMTSLKNALPDVPPLPNNTSSDRSILDFGKAAPGEEQEAPSIVINIPLNGESNKYINFMRLAEETYGWDALHPRQAADRERKARIAAASAALEKQQSRGDNATGEEEDPASDDADSDENENADDSNVEMGGMGGGDKAAMTSGAEGPATQDPEKPKRKRRNWREDEYDKMDGFVDDTDMLWEEQAAAVKDGFFVYSGPLVPEVPKPAVTYVVLFCYFLFEVYQFSFKIANDALFTATDQLSVDAAGAQEVAAQARVADAVAARADAAVGVVAQARAAVRQHASHASRSSRNSAWRRRRPSARAWRKRSAARLHHRRQRRRVMLVHMACSCRLECQVCRQELVRLACWQDNKNNEATPK